MTDARVIGAGLSGLATAWCLTEAGARVHVSDAGSGPGGLITTRRTPQGLVETAAIAFTGSDRVDALFRAAGISPCLPQSQSARRYIFRNGRPRRWPLTLTETLALAMRGGGTWARRQMRPKAGETVAEWGARVVGPAATTWLLAPALQGIYASPPESLSAMAIFGGKRAKRGKLVAPAAGMGELMERLHNALVARGVVFEFGAQVEHVDTSVPTVICTNAPAAARLLTPHAPHLASAIARIRMVSLVTATTFFEPHRDDLHGFGVLFPRSSGVRALGVLFNAEIFAGRSEYRSETWIYGDLDAASLPRAESVAGQVVADRARLTSRSDSPVACYEATHVDALPVYGATVLDAQAALDELPPTIAIAGNYLGRLGVAGLLENAAEASARIASALR